MMNLTGKRIAIISTDYFEEAELIEPLTQLRDMKAVVDVVAPHSGTIQALRHVDRSQKVAVDKTLDKVVPDDYDAVIIPGGVVNADHLRMEESARSFVREMAKAGKPVAAICHGPWLLVSSGLVSGHTFTSYPTLQDDIRNAGGTWKDEEVVVDDNFITSRKPDDIPAFMDAIVDTLK